MELKPNITKDIEVLENLRQRIGDDRDVSSPLYRDRQAALSRAIAAMKAKSDAEVVCEWVTTGKGCGFAREAANEVKLFTFEEDCVIHEAPTLADLAKKIGETK